MNDIIDNTTDSVKNFLKKYGIENISEVIHIGNFVFKASTPSSYIKIITEPFDEEQKYIKVLSVTINLTKSAIEPKEQELLVALARNKTEDMYNFFNSKLCKKQYSTEDIISFKSIIDSSIPDTSAIKKYWNLDTAARDYFIEIIHTVFCTTLLR